MHTTKKYIAAIAALAFWGGLFAPAASASSVDALIEKLVEKRILTRLDAETIRAEVETAQTQSFKQELKKSNSWLEGITQKGDMRLRYEAFSRESEDSSDRNRFRFRARWGVEKKFNDEWKAGFRLASGGGTTEATSTNQSFDGEFGLKDVFIDKAYATYTPTKHWQEILPMTDMVEIGGGKVDNPYAKWATSIIWDGDVTPEGFYLAYDANLWTGENDDHWKLHLLEGYFVLDEDSNLSPGDHEVWGHGIGTTYQWAKGHNASVKMTYYDWQDYAAFLKSSSALANSLGGNDREVDDFKVINLYGEVNFEAPTPIWGTQAFKVYGDYAHNTDAGSPTGTSSDETLQNPALRDDEEDAFSIGVTMGKAKEAGEWQAGYEYLYIEANSTPGVFTESDLGVGHANNQGHKLSYKYMLHKNIEFNLTAWIVERINKTKLTYGLSDLRPNGDDDQVIRTQVDLVYKF